MPELAFQCVRKRLSRVRFAENILIRGSELRDGKSSDRCGSSMNLEVKKSLSRPVLASSVLLLLGQQPACVRMS
jgi:hypothetical protein